MQQSRWTLQSATPDEHAKMMATRREMETKEAIRRERFGEINPAVHCDWKAQGKKVVAVGNVVCIGDFKTFPDFLASYLQTLLTKEWILEEEKRPAQERHPIALWFEAMIRRLAQGRPVTEEKVLVRPSGGMMCYILLAYDLYALQHHSLLQNRLLTRIKSRDGFQGARYELFVAATMVRAGFDIKFEDETDVSRKHPEFVATDRATGVRIAVEAKSKHRAGVLGFKKAKTSDSDYRLNIQRLIHKALEKKLDYPYLVFVDINMPPSEGGPFQRPWFKEFRETIERANAPADEVDEFNAIVLTNIPHHYDDSLNSAPGGDCVTVLARKPKHSLPDIAVLRRIHEAAAKYGAIPGTFEEAS